jgi:hypothetical protein
MKDQLQETSATLKLINIAKQRLIKKGLKNPTKDMIDYEVKNILRNLAKNRNKGQLAKYTTGGAAVGLGVGLAAGPAVDKKLKEKVNEGKVGAMVQGAKVAINSKGLNSIRSLALRRLAKRGITNPTFSQLKNEIKAVRLMSTKAKYAAGGVGVVGSGAVVAATKKESKDVCYKNYILEVVQNNIDNFTCDSYDKLLEKVNKMNEEESKLFIEGIVKEGNFKDEIKKDVKGIGYTLVATAKHPWEYTKTVGRLAKSIPQGTYFKNYDHSEKIGRQFTDKMDELKKLYKLGKISKEEYSRRKNYLEVNFLSKAYTLKK